MTHASGKQPYGCCQPRMVELRSCLPLRMVELCSCFLPSCRNPRVHPSKMTMNFMMDWAAAEAEDEEVEAEDAQDSGTVSDGLCCERPRSSSSGRFRLRRGRPGAGLGRCFRGGPRRTGAGTGTSTSTSTGLGPVGRPHPE